MRYDYTDLFNQTSINNRDHGLWFQDVIDSSIIELTSAGNLIIPSGFDVEIAEVKDYNSNSITFKIPQVIKGHTLKNCSIQAVEWTNLTSKLHGATKLIESKNIHSSDEEQQVYFYKTWVIAPETHTEAGDLEISLVFGDKDKESEKINFLWHSDILKGLKVSRSIEAPGFYNNTGSNLAQIIVGTKKIYLPKNFNRIIGSNGDVNSNKITFQCDQMINGHDILDSNIHGCIRWVATDDIEGVNMIENITELNSYNAEFGEVVQFDWTLPPDLCSHPGTFKFNVCFYEQETIEAQAGDEGIDKSKYIFKWSTLDNDELSIADGITNNNIDGTTESSTSVVIEFQVSETEIQNMLDAAFPAEITEV